MPWRRVMLPFGNFNTVVSALPGLPATMEITWSMRWAQANQLPSGSQLIDGG